jgi:thiamine-phosphate diphosphorylase
MSRLPRPVLCLVTAGAVREDGDEASRDLARLAGRAAAAGVDLIQVRESTLHDRALTALTERILGEIDRPRTRVVLNDRADVALAAGADGVHLRADGVAASRLRAVVPPGFIIGRSVHSTTEAVQAEADAGVDYLIFGTVFASASKPAEHPVAGIDGLRAVCDRVRVPVIAIGGITLDRLPEIAATGAAGFAAIGLFAEANRESAERMGQLVQQARSAFDSGSSLV